jgi:hypothetical protein
MSEPTKPSLQLLMKLGSIVVHTDEFFNPDGHDIDRVTILNMIDDPEVQEWIKDMGAFLPLRRKHE